VPDRTTCRANASSRLDVSWSAGARLYVSTVVVIETFAFLDRRASRPAALAWRASLAAVRRLRILGVSARDLAAAWPYFERKDLPKPSLVDATSFVLMRKQRIRVAFAFDGHFGTAGFLFVT
jgi:predicted nucleic acid-binding protein